MENVILNQVETHPFSQKTAMQQALKSQGIQLQSWAPFAQGKMIFLIINF
ncbi:hypothetical protein [Pedobacter sp. MR2016-24]|nr:hypothetical protein [Pedobacter sp. MR2016-24]MCX2483712.1 hypothetical protein [Pedobacter sp. MR2016-24]